MVLTGAGVEHLFAERLKLTQRAGLILTDHPAVTDDISRQNRRKPPLDALLGHASSRALTAKFYAPEEGESMRVDLWLRVAAEATRPRLASSAMVGKQTLAF